MKKIVFISMFFLSVCTFCYAQKKRPFIGFKTESKEIYDLCFTDKGGALGIADNNNVKVYSTITYSLLAEFINGHHSQILAMDISKDSSRMVSGDKDGNIVIWNFMNRNILKVLHLHNGGVISVKLSSDKRFLVSGGEDKKVCLYDMEKNELIHEFKDHEKEITSVRFCEDRKLLATASGDKTIKIYELDTYKLVTTLREHKNWVREISFSRDGQKLISCGDDSRVIIRDISDIHNIRVLNNYVAGFDWILSVEFNEDSKTYAYGGMFGRIQIIFGPYAKYYSKISAPVNRIRFQPNFGINLNVAIATRGKGVILRDANDMN